MEWHQVSFYGFGACLEKSYLLEFLVERLKVLVHDSEHAHESPGFLVDFFIGHINHAGGCLACFQVKKIELTFKHIECFCERRTINVKPQLIDLVIPKMSQEFDVEIFRTRRIVRAYLLRRKPLLLLILCSLCLRNTVSRERFRRVMG